MAITNINVAKLYRGLIHAPCLANDVNKSPLYAVAGEYQVEEVSALSRDQIWLKACELTYNSPTNVRKLFITSKYVAVQYYKPFIQKGQPSSEGCLRIRKVTDANLYDNLMSIAEFNSRAASGGDFAYSGIKGPEYKVIGNMLSGIRSPWVLSNLEEVYVDCSIFMSEGVNKLKPDIMTKLFMLNQVKPIEGKTQLLETILLRAVDSREGIDQLIVQFNRLKVFGIIPELDSYIQGKIIERRDTRDKPFCDVLKAAGQDGQSVFYKTPSFSCLDNGKLTTRNYYRFDKEVLTPYATQLAKTCGAAIEEANKRRTQERQAEIEASKNSFEKAIDNIEKTYDSARAELMFNLAISCYRADDRKAVLDSLSPDGKLKYEKLI